MWKRRTIKKKAILLMKQGYFRMLPVCFLIAMLTTAYSVSTTFFNLQMPSGSVSTDAAFTAGLPNSEAVLDTAARLLEGTPLAGISHGMIYNIAAMVIDLFSANISVFFSFLRTANYFLTENISIALIFPAAGILCAFLYQIFISNVLLIGEKRFLSGKPELSADTCLENFFSSINYAFFPIRRG